MTATTPPPDLEGVEEELRALLEKATPGELRIRPADRDGYAAVSAPHWMDFAEFVIQIEGDTFASEEGIANVKLFVVARNHLPALLSALAGMREALRMAKKLCDNINEFGACTDYEIYDAAHTAILAALAEGHAAMKTPESTERGEANT